MGGLDNSSPKYTYFQLRLRMLRKHASKDFSTNITKILESLLFSYIDSYDSVLSQHHVCLGLGLYTSARLCLRLLVTLVYFTLHVAY